MPKRTKTTTPVRRNRTKITRSSNTSDENESDHDSESTQGTRRPTKRRRPDESVKLNQEAEVELETTFVRPKLGGTRKAVLEAHYRRALDKKDSNEEDKNKRRSKGKNQGKLTVFMGLPLDVLDEVTSFLWPADILQLSRVSKSFRYLFNPHTARHFWIEARRNVPGLPDCPPDLNEAQYASLLFERHCQACGAQQCKIFDFALRHRTCKPCYKELTKKGHIIIKGFGDKRNRPDPIVFKLVPHSCYNLFLPRDWVTEYWHKWNVDELSSVIKHYLDLEENKKKQAQFVDERIAVTNMMLDTGEAMFDWANDFKNTQKTEELAKYARRVKETKRRLLELGWTEVDIDDGGLELKSLMYQPRDITPRIWKQALPKLEECLRRNARHRKV